MYPEGTLLSSFWKRKQNEKKTLNDVLQEAKWIIHTINRIYYNKTLKCNRILKMTSKKFIKSCVIKTHKYLKFEVVSGNSSDILVW